MFKRLLCSFVIACFCLTTVTIPQARANTIGLPAPGTMVNLSAAYEPAIIKGITIHKDNPILFDFIVDPGQDILTGQALKEEGNKLIKYFLAGLAIPENDLWVNLSPYEKNKMIPEALGQTDMGRDLLAQDYILKQITASLIYPEKDLGKKFWDKVYAKAQAMYGTTEIPVNTFNKVWIMADKAEVFERNNTAFVVGQHLKVMLESDYLALSKNECRGEPCVRPQPGSKGSGRTQGSPLQDANQIGAQIIREIILPELEHEVNTGHNFANLRQIFNSIILSSWYKKNLKEALLSQAYADKSKINGITVSDPTVKQQIYDQYLKAYKKGVFNYIKDASTQPSASLSTSAQPSIPRKYFSGGFTVGEAGRPTLNQNPAMLSSSLPDRALVVMNVGVNPNQRADGAMLGALSEGRSVTLKYPQEVKFTIGGDVVKVAALADSTEALITLNGNFFDRIPTGQSTPVGVELFVSVHDGGVEVQNRTKLDIPYADAAMTSLERPQAIQQAEADFPDDVRKFLVGRPPELGPLTLDELKRWFDAHQAPLQEELGEEAIKKSLVVAPQGNAPQFRTFDVAGNELTSPSGNITTYILKFGNVTIGIKDAAMTFITDGNTLDRMRTMLSEEYTQPVIDIVIRHIQGQSTPYDTLVGILRGTKGQINLQAAQWLVDSVHLAALYDLNYEEFKVLRTKLNEIPLTLSKRVSQGTGDDLSIQAAYLFGQWRDFIPPSSAWKQNPAGVTNVEKYLLNLKYSEDVINAVRDYLLGKPNLLGILQVVTKELGSEEDARWLLDASWIAAFYRLDQNSFIRVRDNISGIWGSDYLFNENGYSKVATAAPARDARRLFDRWRVILDAAKSDAAMTNAEIDMAMIGPKAAVIATSIAGAVLVLALLHKEAEKDEWVSNRVPLTVQQIDPQYMGNSDKRTVHFFVEREISRGVLDGLGLQFVFDKEAKRTVGLDKKLIPGRTYYGYFPVGKLPIWENVRKKGFIDSIRFFLNVQKIHPDYMGNTDLRTVEFSVSQNVSSNVFGELGLQFVFDVQAQRTVGSNENLVPGRTYYGYFFKRKLPVWERIQESGLVDGPSDFNAPDNDKAQVTPGGIDLNTANGMQWKVSKDGSGVEMTINPAMIAKFKREGIESLTPVIFKITPIANIWPLVGLEAPKREVLLAKV